MTSGGGTTSAAPSTPHPTEDLVPGRIPLVFAAVALLGPVLAVLLPPTENLPVLAAGTVATVSAVAITAATRDQGPVGGLAGPTLFLVAVLLLRHAEGGSASGLSPLVILPLFWTALSGTRAAVLAISTGIGLVLVLPILLIGGADYPVGEWRRAIVWLAVGPTIGLAVQHLVERVREANNALEELARTDALTGVLNRRGFVEVAERELRRARRTGEPVVAALLDLDHFKQFNDTFGHPAGDRLLAGAARAWEAELRDVDVLARWGGEEFVVLLPHCPELVAQNVLDRLRLATPEGRTCSIGFASWKPGESLEELNERADRALYEAKEGGRNRVVASGAAG